MYRRAGINSNTFLKSETEECAFLGIKTQHKDIVINCAVNTGSYKLTEDQHSRNIEELHANEQMTTNPMKNEYKTQTGISQKTVGNYNIISNQGKANVKVTFPVSSIRLAS